MQGTSRHTGTFRNIEWFLLIQRNLEYDAMYVSADRRHDIAFRRAVAAPFSEPKLMVTKNGVTDRHGARHAALQPCAAHIRAIGEVQKAHDLTRRELPKDRKPLR